MGNKIISFLFAALVFSSPAHSQTTPLQNNSSRDNLFGGEESARYYSIFVPPGYGRLVVQTSGNDVGDCDVYVRFGSLPTTGTYDARSQGAGNNEKVTITNPASGTWYIMLYAYSTYLSLHFEVLYDGAIDTNVSVGNKIWDLSLDDSMVSSPCLAPNGMIYAATEAGDLWAIQSDGTAQWHKYVGGVSATPALASDGTIYVIRAPGQLMALTSTGSTKWTFSQTTHQAHPVALGRDGTIYVPSNGNALYAVNPTGNLKWQFAVEAGYSASAPAVIGTDGTVYCGFYHPNIARGILLAITPDGKERWRYNLSGKINSPAIDSTGAIIFGSPQPVNKVYAIQANGVRKWESTVSGGGVFSECYVYSAPVISTDGTIYISSNRRLMALSPSDGREKWHYDSNVLLVEFDRPNGPALDSTGTIYFGSLGIFGAGHLYAVRPDGKLAWTYNVGGEVACPPIITKDGKIIFGTANGTQALFALKAAGGQSESTWPVSRQNVANTASLETAPVTRLSITLAGNLAFNSVSVGSTATNTFTITNTGTALVTVQSISYPAGFSGAWSGTIAAGQSRNVTVIFTPTLATLYSGLVTVLSDASGINTIPISGTGTNVPAKNPQIYFQDTSGTLAVWYVNGVTLDHGALLSPVRVDSKWHIAGSGDWNGDAMRDILFEHSDGSMAVWLMIGEKQISSAFINPRTAVDRNWHIAATADINKDGKSDIIFQHTNGTIAVWFMNGVNFVSASLLNPSFPGNGWTVMATGDFNADSAVDLVLQQSNGTVGLWLMNGTTLTKGMALSNNPGSAWRVVSVSDRNEDGKPDLLFQHTNGDLAVWLMNGTAFQSATYLSTRNPGGTWKAAGPR